MNQGLGAMIAPDDGRTDWQTVDVAILGAGFGGLCMALQLLAAGNRDFVILEQDQDIGGTWRDNTYPGAACDVQSHLYSLSFEPKADWSARYAGWREIQQYLTEIVERRGLRPFIRFGRRVNSARFDAASGRWTVATEQGDCVSARHFVMATGPLHRPSLPQLPGLTEFQGPVFHSARWDHSVDLRGKRVAAIGTGASAVQYCPEIAPQVHQLHVFQRTPAWVIPRDDRTYSAVSQWCFSRLPGWRRLHRTWLYALNESRVWPFLKPGLGRPFEWLCRAWLRSQVNDPATAKALMPSFRIGCKRVMRSNAWYPMFNRPNVELVTAGIRQIRAHSILTADGCDRPVDVIILGTGFVVDPRIYLRGFPVVGLEGRDLRAEWREGAQAYYGITVNGFPNLYKLLGPNTALGHNSVVFMIASQVRYALSCMRAVRERGAAYLDVKSQVQRLHNEALQGALARSVWASGCTSWYQQDDGRNFTLWPHTTLRYWQATRHIDVDDYRFAGQLATRA